MSTVKIRTQRSWIAYPGSTLQQNYAEDVKHGFLLWEIDDRDHFDVKFCELPNPRPFITIDWCGSIEATMAVARTQPVGARFRVRNNDVLTQKEVTQLTSALRNEMRATEVTFKSERQVSRGVVSAGAATLVKEDLRNPEVLMRLVRDYHSQTGISDEEWAAIKDQLVTYLQQTLHNDDVVRNTKWSLRHLSFDNTFTYGEGNVISFEQLNGIVGIFGPNRVGKSSIVGTIMYALFNTTDRGNVKNLHVVNVRQPYCYTRAIVNVNSTNYVVERQTTKHENNKGQVYAGTSLNVFRIDESGTAIDMAGEQRNDTEKVIRHLLGAPEDCLLTSVAAQDDVKLFINQGTTKRRKDLSRFLDLDIFDKMYEQAKLDVNVNKATLRKLPDRDWESLEEQLLATLAEKDTIIKDKEHLLHDVSTQLHEVRSQLSTFRDVTPVTLTQIEQQQSYVANLRVACDKLRAEVLDAVQGSADRASRVERIDRLLAENDIGSLQKRLDAMRSLQSSLEGLRLAYEKDVDVLAHQERSLKILDEVPCGDSFPSCKFISDAFNLKDRVGPQREKAKRGLEKVAIAEASLAEIQADGIPDKVSKLQQLMAARVGFINEAARLDVVRDKKEYELGLQTLKLDEGVRRLSDLNEALKNEENHEVVTLRLRLDELQRTAKKLDAERLGLASEVGRIQSDYAKMDVDRRARREVLQLMKAHELIAQACSRKGIPSRVVASQLPIINAEVADILNGIVDFTIEMEQDDDSDSMEIYIDYGDSRRIIELASGMEKTIASLAIRVALINVTSLPKSDMFVIDESFGPLDPSSVEACNRLLISLKRYFKTIVVITHVDGVKDVADHIIEVSKVEKDARVVYDIACHNDPT